MLLDVTCQYFSLAPRGKNSTAQHLTKTLELMSASLKEVKEELRELKASTNNNTAADQPPVNYIEGLPLESMGEFHAFETSLQDPENKQRLVMLLFYFFNSPSSFVYDVTDKFCQIDRR